MNFDAVRRAVEAAPTGRRPAEGWLASMGFNASALTKAAVLIALREGEDDGKLEIVLTRRVEHLKHHAGQVSFPGGRIDPGDASVEHAALREAHEEIGLDPAHVTTVGRLVDFPTITGYVVTPVVGFLAAGHRLVANPAEVAEIFTVPLAFVQEPANVRRSTREVGGVSVPIFVFDYAGRLIWGATAAMIVEFRDIILRDINV